MGGFLRQSLCVYPNPTLSVCERHRLSWAPALQRLMRISASCWVNFALFTSLIWGTCLHLDVYLSMFVLYVCIFVCTICVLVYDFEPSGWSCKVEITDQHGIVSCSSLQTIPPQTWSNDRTQRSQNTCVQMIFFINGIFDNLILLFYRTSYLFIMFELVRLVCRLFWLNVISFIMLCLVSTGPRLLWLILYNANTAVIVDGHLPIYSQRASGRISANNFKCQRTPV